MSETQTIWRYTLPIEDEVTLTMPVGAAVLSVASPRADGLWLDLWAVVDANAGIENRHFRIVGTGNPMPSDAGRFVGTASVRQGAFIWHVFEASGRRAAS